MSNDQQLAVLTGNGANLPAFAKQGAGAELNKEAKAGTGGESINRISLKQSRFRLIVGGEQVSVIQEPYMDVVVVRTNPNISKAYYSKKYDPNAEDQAPDCYSSNGVVPDDDAQNKQCNNCAQCPQNQWGSKISDVSGAKVKACSDIKRIAIVPASNVEAPMFQIAVPAGSLKVWGNYVRMLDQATPAIPYNGVVTRVSFDPDSDYPKLKFEPQSWVTDEQYAVIQRRYESEEAKTVTTTVDAPTDREPTKDAATQAFTQPANSQPEPEQKQPEPEPQPEQKQAEPDPWAQATAKAEQTKEEAPAQEQASQGQADAFAQAGWGTPDKPAAAQDKTPPAQEHVESKATVVEGGDNSSIDDVFGAGFDD